MEDDRELQEARKMPLEDRASHKNWKARVEVFDELRTRLERCFSADDPFFYEAGPLIAKGVGDANASVQDKALEAAVVMLQRGDERIAMRYLKELLANVFGKALKGRSTAVRLCQEVCLLLTELEQGDVVIESAIKTFNDKVPKVALTAIEIVFQIVACFGVKVVKPQPVLKALSPLFDSKDAKIREFAKQLVVELGKWVGVDLIRQSLMEKMRDAMKKDVEEWLSKGGGGRGHPTRFTRKEQARLHALQAAPAPASDAMDVDEVPVAAAPVAAAVEVPQGIDPYEFAEPFDLLSTLRPPFWEKIEASKWTDRRDVLQELGKLASNPKLVPGDYGALLGALKKVVTKDSNVVCVAEALNVIACLARGLRGSFGSAARAFLSYILEKLKDKNMGVIKACQDSLTAVHTFCLQLHEVVETVVPAVQDKNPKTRLETLRWLGDCARREPKSSLQKANQGLLPVIVKAVMDADAGVRELAAACIVDWVKKMGTISVLDKYAAGLDEGKRKMLDDKIQEAVGAARGAAPGAPSTSAAAAARTLSASVATLPTAPAPPKLGRSFSAAAPRAGSMTAAGGSRAASPGKRGALGASAQGPVGARPGTAPARKAASSANAAEDDDAPVAGPALSKEEAEFAVASAFGQGVVTQLGSSNWKERLEGMEQLQRAACVRGVNPGVGADCLVVFLGSKPGWSDKNVQVLGKIFEVVQFAAAEFVPFSKRDAYQCLDGMLDRMPDAKLKGTVALALLSFAEAVGPQFVAAQTYKKAVAHKNPKVLVETLTWVATAVADFGLQSFTVKSLLEWIKTGLGNSNAGVRDAAIKLAGVLHRSLGPSLVGLLQTDLKPALLSSLQAECERNPLQLTPPTRKVRGARAPPAAAAPGGYTAAGPPPANDDDAMDVDEPSHGGAPAPAPFPALDLLPREDVSGQITGKLLQEMASDKWKERQAALHAVEAILQGAGYRITPAIGDLMGGIKGRFGDANRNLAATALTLVASLAKAMGAPIVREVRPVLTDALKCIADTKTQVRGAVLGMLDQLSEAAGAEWLLPGLLEVLQKPNCPAEGKKDGITWLTRQLAASDRGVQGEALGHVLKLAALALGDKAVEVREAGNQLSLRIAERAPGPELQQQLRLLPPAKKQLLDPVLGKAMGAVGGGTGLPAMMPPPARPGTAPAMGRSLSATAAAVGSSVRASKVGGLNRSMTSGGRPLTAAAAPSIPPPSLLDAADGPLLLADARKEERARRQRVFKPSAKMDEVRQDDIDALEADLLLVASRGLVEKMFSRDFKLHCDAADTLRAALMDAALSEAMHSFLDLVLRWCALRINEGNTQSLLKTLDLVRDICGWLQFRGLQLSDYEALLILPALIDKAGHNQDRVRQIHREVFGRFCDVFPLLKAVEFLTVVGLGSANKRTRVVWLEEIGSAFERAGGEPALTKALPSVVKLVEEKDAPVRNAAVACCAAAYRALGQGVFPSLGRISEGTRKVLEDKFKYVQPLPLQQQQQNLVMAATMPAAPAAPRSPRRSSMAAASGRASLNTLQGSNGSHPAPLAMTMPLQYSSQPMDVSAAAPPVPAMATALHSLHPQQQMQMQMPMAAPAAPQTRLPPPFPMRPVLTEQLQSTALDGALPRTPTLAQAGVASFRDSPGAGGVRTDTDSIDRWARGVEVVRSSLLYDAVEGMKLLIHELQAVNNGLVSDTVLGRFAAEAEELTRLLGAHGEVAFFDGRSAGSAANLRACKYILNTLMQAFQHRAMASMVSEPTLRALLGQLLAVLVDTAALAASQEGGMLLRALNVLVLKVLENSSMTYSFAALIDLLVHFPPRIAEDAARVPQFLELVVKCLIKLTKALPQAIAQGRADVDALLFAIHGFMMTLGVEEIRRRGSEDDRPLRMVKTILHELCKLLGTDIRNHFSRLPAVGANAKGGAVPIIHRYIEVNLETLHYTGLLQTVGAPSPHAAPAAARADSRKSIDATTGLYSTTTTDDTLMGGPASAAAPAPAHAPIPAPPPPAPMPTPGAPASPGMRALGPEEKDTLFDILLRVGDRAKSAAALEELFDFLQAHPRADVMGPIRQAVSASFQQYVERGLAKVADRRQKAAAHRLASFPIDSTSPSDSPGDKPPGLPAPQPSQEPTLDGARSTPTRIPSGPRTTDRTSAVLTSIDELKMRFSMGGAGTGGLMPVPPPPQHHAAAMVDDMAMDVDSPIGKSAAPSFTAALGPVASRPGSASGQQSSIEELKARMMRLEGAPAPSQAAPGAAPGSSAAVATLQSRLRALDNVNGHAASAEQAQLHLTDQHLRSSLQDLQQKYAQVLQGGQRP